MNPKATEVEKRMASILFNDKAEDASTKDLNSLAALTFVRRAPTSRIALRVAPSSRPEPSRPSIHLPTNLARPTRITQNGPNADAMFKMLKVALDPQQNTWQTMLKGVILLDHFVRFGVCVFLQWFVV